MGPSSDIDSLKISTYVRELELTNLELTQKVQRLESKSVNIDKFENTAITVEACARMHGVCVQTVRQYIKDGYIPEHPDSTDRKKIDTNIRCDITQFQTTEKSALGRYA